MKPKNLFVRFCRGDKVIFLHCHADETFLEVKQRLKHLTQVRPDNMQLQLHSHILRDEAILKDHVENDTRVIMVYREPSGVWEEPQDALVMDEEEEKESEEIGEDNISER
ncbi:hypothetical protein ADUPG1_011783 [Aduncisulcus paluster]|uniref:Ubiquitin-like domain-containing protein n=1 Tax=Aduncisulcus paluster TaxID=2918883 RepID=A0ABQ5JZ10_9EUKA|nr:hypothetical protein ADUPG1_011783 [Aduncisulcus paluster]